MLEELEHELRHGRFSTVAARTAALLDGPAAAGQPQAALRLLRATAWRRSGRQREAEAELEALAVELGAADGPALLAQQVKLEQAKLFSQRGPSGRAREWAKEVAQASAALGALQLECDAHLLMGMLDSLEAQPGLGQQHFEQGLDCAVRAGDDFRTADARSMLGMSLIGQGQSFEGIGLWRQALTYHEAEGNTAAVATQLNRIGYAAWCDGDLEQARRTLLRVLSLADGEPEAVPPQLRMMAEFNLASVDLFAGRLDDAERMLDSAARRALMLGDGMLNGAVHIQRVALALLRGRPSEALACRTAALRAMAEIKDEPGLAGRMVLALAQLAAGQLAQARDAWPAELPATIQADERMGLCGVELMITAQTSRLTDEAAALAAAWLGQVQAALAPLPQRYS